MRVTLKQLQVFAALAHHGSIRLAAEQIALSQSATSSSLHELEGALNVPLFDRQKRRLVLNQNGHRLLPRALSTLRQISDIEGKGLPGGTLKIASCMTVGTYLLPEICTRFAAEHPETYLTIRESSSQEVLDRISAMKEDIGFIEDAPVAATGLTLVPWVEDELIVFCAAGHRLANKTVPHIALRDETWILKTKGSHTRAKMWAQFSGELDRVHVPVVTNSIEAIKRSVRTGRGISCLSHIAVREEIEHGVLARIFLSDMTIRRWIYVVMRKDLYQGELVESFLAEVLQRRREEAIRNTGTRVPPLSLL